MRMAIIAHHLRVAGGAVVGKNLLATFAEQAPQHQYWISIPDDPDYHRIVEQFPNAELFVFKPQGGILGRLFHEKTTIAKAVNAFEPDVLLGMGGIGLDRPPCPQALLVQDSHYFYPTSQYQMESWKPKLIKAFHKRRLGRQLHQSELLCCQTEVALRRCTQAFSFKGRTTIVPNAVTRFANTAANAPMPDGLKPYHDRFRLFYLTKYYAHKNLEGIVETFDRFRGELEGVVVILTVSAEQHPRAGRFIRSIAERGLESHIINVGPLPYDEIGGYYRHVDGLLMPTYLESFSGTYLEAMHFETPILTSDLDFARGICGDAALYFDQTSPVAMKDAILELKNDVELANNLRRRGREHLESMYTSWTEIGSNLMNELEQLAARRDSSES